ncbi:MAG: 4Fe-4S dicluster domain-containing protein [Coriobacteriales bacterium]|jgi:sulfhydrogenase subunit beta (sulfur reductase)
MLLRKDKLDDLLTELSKEAVVYVPKEVSGIRKFAPYISADTMKLGEGNTKFPPKDLLFPQSQKMYHYGVGADGNMFIDPIVESSNQVLFGARPCDMRSIECMDDVFLTKGYVDEYYSAKRDKLLTVALGCTEPAETCFCESMGLDPNNAPAADIMLRDCGDAYTVAAQTERGQAALDDSWKQFLEDGDATPEDVHCTLSVNAEGIKDRMAKLYESDELWDAMSIKCLNCGTCTFLCPTCYCFDIDQENRCKEGVRFRCWDSCMFSEYTAMAGGHNPRPEKKDRVRNRFMHKLSYFEDRYGKMLCVGCGRCVAECPVALDITVLIDRANELAGKEAVNA